ncbi:MAG: ATP phosphoribosyltransferase [Aggregatilineales bacterium]
MTDKVTLALPSKGAIAEPTYNFLKDCSLKIHKPNERQYVGRIPKIAEVEVLFQRVKDVLYKVSDGTAQLGITGYDVVKENFHQDLLVIHPQLGYGHCQLVVAVPEMWADVTSMADVLDVSLDFREQKYRNIRVATTYPNMTREFLHQNGIHHFTIVKADGAIEAAPTIGYADFVVDLTQTGTTLRENHLKIIGDGIIVDSQACLIGNKRLIASSKTAQNVLRTILEHMDAAIVGRKYMQVTVNICGNSAEDIGNKLDSHDLTRGLEGPTIAPIYSAPSGSSEKWYTATLTLQSNTMMDVVDYLRTIGGTQIVATPVHSVFMPESETYKRVLDALR